MIRSKHEVEDGTPFGINIDVAAGVDGLCCTVCGEYSALSSKNCPLFKISKILSA